VGTRRWSIAALLLIAGCACNLTGGQAVRPSTPSSARRPGAQISPPGEALPITTSTVLSSPAEDPSVLVPKKCTLVGKTLTAQGTFQSPPLPEDFTRVGDVVELYAYSVPLSNHVGRLPDQLGTGEQVVDLASETPYPMQGSGPWSVSGPVDSDLPAPQECVVAVQSTHAFMGAGDAGG
jgi:hypothetical protein